MPTPIEPHTADEQAVIDAVAAIGTLADHKAFSSLRALLADELEVDYSSLTGHPRAKMNADELIAGWTKGLSRFHQTEHLVGRFKVKIDADRADCFARFIATHVHDAESKSRWTIGGTYHYVFSRTSDGWKVIATTMTMEWEQGPR